MNIFISLTFVLLGCHCSYAQSNECTYFQGAECAMCLFECFTVDDTPITSIGGMSSNSWGAVSPAATPSCVDSRKWFEPKCPAGGCTTDDELAACQKYCNQCGEDNYLKTERIVLSSEKSSCAEVSGKWPFACLKPQMVQTMKNNTLLMKIAATDAVCASTNPDTACVRIRYRRRGNSGCPPSKLTCLTACNSVQDPYTGFDPRCRHPYDSGLDVGTHVPNVAAAAGFDASAFPFRHELTKEECYNKWVCAEASFPIDCVDMSTDINVFSFHVTPGVDHFDIESVTITENACAAPNTFDQDGTLNTVTC